MRRLQLRRADVVCSLGRLFLAASQIGVVASRRDPPPTDFPGSTMSTPGPNGVEVIAGMAITWNGGRQSLTCRSNENTPVLWNVSCPVTTCQYDEFLLDDNNGSTLSLIADSSWNNSIITCSSVRSNSTNDHVFMTIIVRELPQLTIAPSPIDLYESKRLTKVQCSADTAYMWPANLQWYLVYTNGQMETTSEFVYTRDDDSKRSLLMFQPSPLLQLRMVVCGYRVGAQPPYVWVNSTASVETIKLPAMEIYSKTAAVYSSIVEVYVGCSTTLVCRAKGVSHLRKGWTIRWSVSKISQVRDYGLLYDIETNNTELLLKFMVGSQWKERVVTCELMAGTNSEEPASRVVATVNIYDPPILSIVNGSSVDISAGDSFELTCVANGYVLGGLQWVTDCSGCTHQHESPVTKSSWGANKTLKSIATSSWDGAKASCVVRSSDWPCVTAAINVTGYKSNSFSTVGLLASCAVAALAGAIVFGALIVMLKWKNQVTTQTLRVASPIVLATSSGGYALPAQGINVVGNSSLPIQLIANVGVAAPSTALDLTTPMPATAVTEVESATPQRNCLKREEINPAAAHNVADSYGCDNAFAAPNDSHTAGNLVTLNT